jgi:hypothetical protein
MFNSFFMEATRSDWIAVVAWAKPILHSVIAFPGIVAEGGRTQKSAAEMAMARRYSKDAQRLQPLTRIRYCISRFVRDDKKQEVFRLRPTSQNDGT